MDLKDKIALVTGGSSGIGEAIAQSLIEAGAKVAITGRNVDRLNAAAKRLGAHAIQADVSNEADVRRTMEEVLAKFGRLDILINNAGLGTFKPLVEMELADMRRVFETNVFGAMLMGREAAKYFISQDKGHIVNIGSTISHRCGPMATAYGSSKYALRGMTECWRAELRKHNIRVMLINPSEVITNFGDAAGFEQKKDNPTKLIPEDIAHVVKAALEMHDRGFTTELTVFATNPQD